MVKHLCRRINPSQRSGCQYLSICYSDKLVEAGIDASVGSVGDSHDNAQAETINGSYKTEVIQHRVP
jgi:putative transposase